MEFLSCFNFWKPILITEFDPLVPLLLEAFMNILQSSISVIFSCWYLRACSVQNKSEYFAWKSFRFQCFWHDAFRRISQRLLLNDGALYPDCSERVQFRKEFEARVTFFRPTRTTHLHVIDGGVGGIGISEVLAVSHLSPALCDHDLDVWRVTFILAVEQRAKFDAWCSKQKNRTIGHPRCCFFLCQRILLKKNRKRNSFRALNTKIQPCGRMLLYGAWCMLLIPMVYACLCLVPSRIIHVQ